MLTDKQKRFADEYLIDLNATQAAIRAGYSAKTSYSHGQRLLKNVEIHAYIEERKADRSKKTLITADFVLFGLKEVAERCMQKVPVMEFDYEAKALVQKVDEDGNGIWEFDSTGANRSLELLGKHLSLFTDKIDHTTNGESLNSEDLNKLTNDEKLLLLKLKQKMKG